MGRDGDMKLFKIKYFLPMNTDGKKYKIEIPSIGEDIFRNQFGDMGNSRKHSK